MPGSKIESEIAQGMERLCVISVMDFTKFVALKPYAQAYLRFVDHAMDFYINKGCSICLVGFCEAEGDGIAIENILKSYSHPNSERIKVMSYNGLNENDMLKMIASAYCVIATRFHSMILALAYGVQVLPVVYNSKCQHTLEDLKCEQFGIQLDDLAEYDFNTVRYLKLDASSEIKAASSGHFKKLDIIFE